MLSRSKSLDACRALMPEPQDLQFSGGPLPRLTILSCWSSLASFIIAIINVLPNRELQERGLKRSGLARRDRNFGSYIVSKFSFRLTVMPWKVEPHKRSTFSTGIHRPRPGRPWVSLWIPHPLTSFLVRRGAGARHLAPCIAQPRAISHSLPHWSDPILPRSDPQSDVPFNCRSWVHFILKEALNCSGGKRVAGRRSIAIVVHPTAKLFPW